MLEEFIIREIKTRLPAIVKKEPRLLARLLFTVIRELSEEELRGYEQEIKKLQKVGLGKDWKYLQQIIEKEKRNA
ncbi:MAG: hypothetical protein Q8O83_02280 [bacterium]|nr:hypothetical protein [bacterium]